jgi:hypothetical protein
MKDFTKFEEYGEIKPNRFAKENLDSGEIKESQNIFANVKIMLKIAIITVIVVNIIMTIAVIANPEVVGVFMAKIVNGFTATMK